MRSLRTRAITGGIIWAILAVFVGVYGLDTLLGNQTERRFDDLLRNRHTQAIVALANSATAPEDISRGIGDPAYARPFSGEYWQIENMSGEIYVSRSLVDALLPRPNSTDDGIFIRTYSAETGDILRGISQWVTLDDGTPWHVQVASSVQSLLDDRAEQRSNLLLAFAVIVVFGIAAALLQVRATLGPLADLRRDVFARWDSEKGLEPDSYPVEVAPLVDDINTLLERNLEIVTRSRRQAADLAHAIKTPSAIVRNELERLRGRGVQVAESLVALDRLDAQLKRSLARIRADGGNAGVRPKADLDMSLGRLARAFGGLARNQHKHLQSRITPGLRVRMDQNDFEEIMGNLMDNALKWAHSEICLTADIRDDMVILAVADDGPGIPKESYADATLSGLRLDTSKPGTGLGLAIAADLAHAYGGKVTLGTSPDLGGLEVRVSVPASGV